jgi:hypothetical protein
VCISRTCLSNANCISLLFSAVSPTNAKVTLRQAEQEPLKSGLPLGLGSINNSGFFMLAALPASGAPETLAAGFSPVLTILGARRGLSCILAQFFLIN